VDRPTTVFSWPVHLVGTNWVTRRSKLPLSAETRNTKLDYCTSLLAGSNKQLVDKLQCVLNCAARVIFGGDRRDHVTPLLRDKLHWLRASDFMDMLRRLINCRIIIIIISIQLYLDERCTVIKCRCSPNLLNTDLPITHITGTVQCITINTEFNLY